LAHSILICRHLQHLLDVKKGDKILFGKWSGTEVKMNGEEYLIMKESDIMGIIISGKTKKTKKTKK